MPETIGFIGLGLMGKPMALNLIKNGFSVIAHSRSAPPVDDVVSAGAARASSPAEVARRCTRIITMVPDSSDVERVLEGPSGVFEAVQPGTILIDMSTISPIVTRRLADAARTRGATLLDAPVSGGEIGAINASLSIMVGGDESAFATVTPILRAMGNPERIVRIGESGAGQICKVCNQMVIGGTLTVVSEAIALARKAHVDPAKVREALLGGFAASRVLDVHGERILTGNYKPGFRAKLYAKDYRIAAETLATNGSPAPVSSVVKGLVDTLAAEHGDADYSALATVIFEMAGISA
ncbi:MAG TPA: NAD(P)-dependent oxidoreductase [Vicinamibacterales bacterium]|jgi:2-hydroxy-3-oxopropionate reductase|nr:NAD(P)-dependent oxidoreductase [Vicinamibacterales bacterium]